ncbi:MAG: protein kinase domain-containing protein, partial [Rhodocyclaceae bacterium]
ASPVLIDFGAARHAMQQAGDLRPVYTPGYAAPEQYEKNGEIGPWTDVYAVGASMYACLAAAAPQPADQRLSEDKLVPASQRWAGRYSPQLLELIDRCLRLDPNARPASAFSLQRLLAAIATPVRRTDESTS